MNESDIKECKQLLNKWALAHLEGWFYTNDRIMFNVTDIPEVPTMGHYFYRYAYYESGIQYRIHYIELDVKTMNYPKLLRHGVLWHEFCHLWMEWDGLGKEPDHGKEFKTRERSCLRLFVGDLLAKFWWGLS